MREKGARLERRNKQAVGVAKRQGPDQRRKSSKRSGWRRGKAPTRERNQASSRDGKRKYTRLERRNKYLVGVRKKMSPD